MKDQIQKTIGTLKKVIIASNDILEEHFQCLSAQEILTEMSNLLQEAIHYRKNERIVLKSSKQMLMRRSKRDITCKITQTQQRPLQKVKIYGKPKIRFDNESFCVTHGLSHYQPQQNINDSSFAYSSKHNESHIHQNQQKLSATHLLSPNHMTIQRVFQFKSNSTDLYHNLSSKKLKLEGKKVHLNEESQLSSNLAKQIRLRELEREAQKALKQVKSINSAKMNQYEVEKMKLKKRLRKQQLKLQKLQKNQHLKKEREGELQCSCCSDDESVIQKLEQIYFAHKKHLQKQFKQSEVKKDKSYKISANDKYPITSSERKRFDDQ